MDEKKYFEKREEKLAAKDGKADPKKISDGNPDDILDSKDPEPKADEAKSDEPPLPTPLDLATKDVLSLIGKVGWWNGKWKAPKFYEGDELELKIDGTFSSAGAAAIEDGEIWLNLADGRINLKRH